MSQASLPPGPKQHFMLGHLPEYGKDPLAFLTRCAREYGDIVQLRFPSTRVYLLNRADYIEQVLSADDGHFARHKGMRLRATQALLGNGLLTSEGKYSRRQRRLALPAFHSDRIVAYGSVMTDYTDQMLVGWRPGQTRDVHQDMMQLTLKIVAKTLFDVDLTKATGYMAGTALGVLKDEFTAQRNSMRSLKTILALPLNARARRAMRQLDRIISKIIRERRTSGEDNGDLLSLLMAASDEDGRPLTEQQLRDEAMTFLFAGHEATGLALSWAWYLLAQRPEADARLVTELRGVLGSRPPRVSDLRQLPFTASVLKETLRLYPPAWAIGREALRDCLVGGYSVPAGTQLIMSQWITHRDPRYFEFPEEFLPERWSNGLSKHLPKYAYFPYGGGARVCIGKAFSEMETVLLLARIAQRFRLTLAPHQRVTLLPTFALVPKDGIKMVISER